MSLGVGLGAFMDGVSNGMKLRDQFDENRRKRKERTALDAVNADAKKTFDAGVAAGTQDPNNFDQFWTQYALPKQVKQLILNGDTEGAQRLQQWGDSSAAKQGGKLFASAMLKAQSGDAEGAMKDALDAAHVQGYIDHGYKLKSNEKLLNPDGSLAGFQLTMSTGDGQDVVQTVPIDKLPQTIATFINPMAAYKTQQETSAATKKRTQDLQDYSARKKIDAQYKTGDDEAAYAKARDARMQNDMDFADMTPSQQDQVVRQDLAAGKAYAADQRGPAASGASSATSPRPITPPQPKRVIVDNATGERVSPNAVGLGATVAPAARAPRAPAPAPQPAGAPDAAAMPVPSARPQPVAASQPAPTGQQQMLNQAAQAIANGGDPRAIADKLTSAGITADQWPDSLRSAVAESRAVGLGQ